MPLSVQDKFELEHKGRVRQQDTGGHIQEGKLQSAHWEDMRVG